MEANSFDAETRFFHDLDYEAQYMRYPTRGYAVLKTLWQIHTHLFRAMGGVGVTPRLALLSPKGGSGKSRAVEISTLFVDKPCHQQNSGAGLMRILPYTLCYEEAHELFSKDGNATVRSLLCTYRSGPKRTISGKDGDPMTQDQICPAIFSARTTEPGCRMSPNFLERCIHIPMVPVTEAEEYLLEDFVLSEAQEEIEDKFREPWATWAEQVKSKVKENRPTIKGILRANRIISRDRELLGCIAETAYLISPKVFDLTMDAIKEYFKNRQKRRENIEIFLDDLWNIVDQTKEWIDDEVGFVSTTHTIPQMLAIEESPWNNLEGKPLSSNRYWSFLNDIDIEHAVHNKKRSARGLYAQHPKLIDAWKRLRRRDPPECIKQLMDGLDGLDDLDGMSVRERVDASTSPSSQTKEDTCTGKPSMLSITSNPSIPKVDNKTNQPDRGVKMNATNAETEIPMTDAEFDAWIDSSFIVEKEDIQTHEKN